MHLPSFLIPDAPNSSSGCEVARTAAPASSRGRSPGARRARPPALASRGRPARPGPRPGPGAPRLCGPHSRALTSSLCVDGHFFRRRPQFSRFPVCRCRVLARARSAPAARLSVPMAAATGGGQAEMGPQAGKKAAPQTPCPRPQSRARGCLPRAAGPRPALGPREAERRRRSGGPGRTRGWLRLLLLRPPQES